MAKFKKKPVVIEAMQFDGKNALDVMKWAVTGLPAAANMPVREAPGCLQIITLEGEMIASPGDWIIKGVKGEFYPCKPDIFDATYEAVGSWTK